MELNKKKIFAFLFFPENSEQLKKIFPLTGLIPQLWKKSLSPKKHKLITIEGLNLAQGQEISGYFIAYPVLLSQLYQQDKAFLAQILTATADRAGALNVNILGTGEYFSSCFYDKKPKFSLTSGSAFTAWSVFEALFRIAKTKKLDLKRSTISILGAATASGSLCARKLADCAQQLTLCADNHRKLAEIKEGILHLNTVAVTLEENPQAAARDAEIVIFSDKNLLEGFDFRQLKHAAIVLAGCPLKDIAEKISLRHDLTFIETGLIKIPGVLKFNLLLGLPQDIIPAALAEVILLALEGKFVNYSCGENVNLDKMDEIADIAVRHGFEVWVPQAPLL